ncbi:hypothetical protein TSOC_012957 [Tetrabaena socialis]|uniref:RRM domain-containing protein n=1 Tax=Tetrabaena socialis TaxID=47790 RepID=A0A2J7ZLM6_9CHLO|nr:hypothetical protein TSOC_012957 [Tetrabaena socialis]|eukprot:PNH01168.1 hypothetical protein TSOC_012957 [Tetrabaena socialis]
MTDKQTCKTFVGGLSWETTGDKLRAYFENFGSVREAFVSYNRNNGRPRGFGFVVFESPEVADKVVATKHMIDRREVEAKKAVPKEEAPEEKQQGAAPQRTKKIFVGGLAPSVDEAQLRQHFSQFGTVEDAVVMYDHENKRPRGFGFVTFEEEEAVDRVFSHGAVQTIADKPIEVKAAVPRDQMPATPRMHASYFGQLRGGPAPGFPNGPHRNFAGHPPYGPPGPGYPPPYGNYARPFNGRAPPANSYGGYGPGPRSPGPGPGPRQQPAPPPGQYGGYPQQRFPPPAQGPGPQSGSPNSAAASQNKVSQPMQNAYDVYGGQLNGVNNAAMLSSLYNIAGLQLQNGLPATAAAAAVNPKQLNSLNHHLKALNLAAGFTNFANQQDSTYQDDAAAAYAATQEDFAASAAEAMQGLNGLAVNSADFNSLHDTGFTTAPAPGWSS